MIDNLEEKITISEHLYIKDVPGFGRGVFTDNVLLKNTIIEISPVLIMSAADRILVDQTPLKDYIFEWGMDFTQCIIGWGYICMYNHKYVSNCEYFMDFENNIVTIKTVRNIQAGEELFINYNGDFDDVTPLWFDAQ